MNRLREIDWRTRSLEVGFWVVFVGLFWTLGAFAIMREYGTAGRPVDMLRLVTNEASSAVSALIMLQFVRYWLTRHPVNRDKPAFDVAMHAVGSVIFSLGHVGILMALRSLFYVLNGLRYDHAAGEGVSGVLTMLAYEYSKDLPLYIGMVIILWLYRHWNKKKVDAPARYPDMILASRGRSSARLLTRQIECLKSAGNYISLFSKGEEFLLRGTMQEMQGKLDPSRFARVHRSYIVNVDAVSELKPIGGGQYAIVLSSGQEVPLGRKYREEFLSRLEPAAVS